jgi:hypothetical protein
MAVPNVEIFTLILFAAGSVLGFRLGIVTALVASFLYFGLNPQGGFFLPLLAAQVVGSISAPLLGTLWRRRRSDSLAARLMLALCGLGTTLWYDLVTNLAYPFSAGFDSTQTLAVLVAGIPFALLHLGSNCLIFFLLAPSLLHIVQKQTGPGY